MLFLRYNVKSLTTNYRVISQLAVIAAAFGVATLLTGCGKKENTVEPVRPALAYKIPAGGGLDLDIFSGEIRARHEADHAFQVGGKMTRRMVDAGATVKRGQLLAQIDAQDVTLAADAARAQVSAQITEADFADAELKRFRDLFATGFVSQSALDQKLNIANAARARLDAQQATANVSLNRSGYAKLVAEMDGVVTQVMADAGQVVVAGQPIIKIANPQEKELVIAVPEAKISEFRGGTEGRQRPIHVKMWSNPDKSYVGKLREIGGAADVVTRTFTARIAIAGADRDIGLGMSAYAAFVGTDAAGSFAVPLSSLYVKGNTTGVWQIAADGRVTLKPIRVLQYRETTALVRADGANSIKPGDTIVAAGVHKLRDGEIVRPIADPQVKGDGKVAYAKDAIDLPTLPGEPAPAPSMAFLDRFLK